MLASSTKSLRAAFAITFVVFGINAFAQSGGNSTSVTGTVLDPTGAVVPNATVEIQNPVSQFNRSVLTSSTGGFDIPNVPFNPYHLTVKAAGFANYVQDVDVRSIVPVNLTINLRLQSSEAITVESNAADLLENDPTFHTAETEAGYRKSRGVAEGYLH